MPKPTGDSTHVDAGGDGLGRSEMTQVVEPGMDTDLVSQPPVGAPEAVRKARLRAIGVGREHVRVGLQFRPDLFCVLRLLHPSFRQERKRGRVDSDIAVLVGLSVTFAVASRA